ncbi:uncharacterized protein DSM5745_01666 [Aspergillus mulundensis]|uniref:Uncharacterized protein n=1 Tax=Aspergillus mulundensis TaxID=1810919 RepID=A0A3D8SUN9_9EURO|nr:Uncharacterized protein DSM5745_01666 [Aspergillus mulundensis]RDW89891.1 Uncharacterized protein DSM5745_01666 [Aspergillus mulundensis]
MSPSTSHSARMLSLASRTSTYSSRPLFSLISRSSILRTSGSQARHNSGVTQDWKGSSGEKSTTHRVQKEKDTTDPETIAASRTMKDREENFGVGNRGESDAATERGGLKNQEKVKKDHPKAPTPVLGINDERAQKGV